MANKKQEPKEKMPVDEKFFCRCGHLGHILQVIIEEDHAVFKVAYLGENTSKCDNFMLKKEDYKKFAHFIDSSDFDEVISFE